MSGSGGYYKYRCKYFFTANCPQWVWVNNAACAHCLAKGWDSESPMTPATLRLSRQIYVPLLENGALHYSIRDIAATSDWDHAWAIKDKPSYTSKTFAIITEPPPESFRVIDSFENHIEGESPVGQEGPSWVRRSFAMD
jgi:hypothetical protein